MHEVRWLEKDARNRALRTFLVGLAIDVLAAVCLAVYEWLNTAGNDVDWRLLPALVLKTLVASAGSYLLRAKLDPSQFWTPLPPAPTPPPNDRSHDA